MFIHTFGCYFGLAACWWLTSKKTHGHPDNCSCYSSDVFSYAGSLFLWMMWPSFNGILGADAQEYVLAPLPLRSFIPSFFLSLAPLFAFRSY